MSVDKLIVTKRNISEGSITPPKYLRYGTATFGKTKGSVVHVIFPPQQTVGFDAPVSVVHGLRRVPRYWQVLDQGVFDAPLGAGSVAPGIIYTDTPAPFTNIVAMFRCTVPYTWAKILLT